MIGCCYQLLRWCKRSWSRAKCWSEVVELLRKKGERLKLKQVVIALDATTLEVMSPRSWKVISFAWLKQIFVHGAENFKTTGTSNCYNSPFLSIVVIGSVALWIEIDSIRFVQYVVVFLKESVSLTRRLDSTRQCVYRTRTCTSY